MKLSTKYFFAAALLWLSSANASAIEQVGGVYQIGTAQDLIDFAGIVNGGAGASNAVLTADIDMKDQGWTPIGQDGKDFKGHFDGQGHRILNLTTTAGYNNQALFGQAVGGAIIENVIIDASCTIQGAAFAAGILGHVYGDGVIVRNCGNEANVNGTAQNSAGIVGCSEKIVHIQNCYNTGNISGSYENAGLCAWMGNASSTLVNCFSSGTVTNGEALYRGPGGFVPTNNFQINGWQGTAFTAAQMASGELAFIMNGNQSTDVKWYQTIGTDAHPMPFGTAVVYANGELYCDGTSKGGELVYSNTNASNRDAHSYGEWGFCTNTCGDHPCDAFNAAWLTPVDGYYEISNNKQLNWFAYYVNTVNQTANAKLTADVDFSEQNIMIGTSQSNAFKGTFDGQGHKITIGYNSNTNNLALFRYIDAATIQNLKIDGSITTNGSQMGGLVSVSVNASAIRDVVVAVNMTSSYDGDGTHGGVIAVASNVPTLQNVAFVGALNASNSNGSCGMIGYAHSGGDIHYTNCYVSGTLTLKGDNNRVFGRNGEYCTNCYTTLAMTKLNNSDRFNGADVTADQVASGELAFLLNNRQSADVAWYQAIGTDAYPTPFGSAVVYANGSLYCDGTAKPGLVYENEEKASTRDAHNYNDWGFCTNGHDEIVCDDLNPNYVTLTDGYYQIGDYKELNWFATLVNRGINTSAKAKLIADIDKADYSANIFPGIGTSGFPFAGEIDGQKHIIKNFVINEPDNRVALVRYAHGGLVLKNITMDKTSSFTGKEYSAAFIADVHGAGSITLTNLGNEADVTITGANGGGIVGCNFSGSVVINMTNVYNVGTITSGNDGGGLGGWLGDNAVTVNCYNAGTVINGESFARGNNVQPTNCFDPVTNWPLLPTSPAEDFTNGKVFAKLFDASNVWRMEFAGTAHPVLYDAAIVLKEDFPNRVVAADNVNLTLKRTTVADTWNTICLPFALTAAQIETVFGTGAKVAEYSSANGTTLNFTSVTTTEAGKAYLVKPTKAITEVELEGVTLVAGAPANDGVFVGTYEPTEIAAGTLFVAEGNKLAAAAAGTIKGFRAYFPQTSSAPAYTHFTVDGQTTDISEKVIVNSEKFAAASVYNLAGQRVATPTKGLYIINGKKAIIK